MGLKRVSTTINQHWTHSHHCLPSCWPYSNSQSHKYLHVANIPPLSHHIHWECRTKSSRHHQSCSLSKYYIHNTWFITTFRIPTLSQVVSISLPGSSRNSSGVFRFQILPAYTTRQWEVRRKSHRPSLKYRQRGHPHFSRWKCFSLVVPFLGIKFPRKLLQEEYNVGFSFFLLDNICRECSCWISERYIDLCFFN